MLPDKRPVYLNLFKIRLPSTGIVSFAHRVSGFLLFLAIPFSIYLLDMSVASQQGFDDVARMLQHPLFLVLLLILIGLYPEPLIRYTDAAASMLWVNMP